MGVCGGGHSGVGIPGNRNFVGVLGDGNSGVGLQGSENVGKAMFGTDNLDEGQLWFYSHDESLGTTLGGGPAGLVLVPSCTATLEDGSIWTNTQDGALGATRVGNCALDDTSLEVGGHFALACQVF